MEATIRIQEEFESLVKQLERLKSIVDITNINTENAKRIIHEISAFVETTNDFSKRIENDFNIKSEQLSDVLNAIKKGSDTIDINISELKGSIKSSFDSLNVNSTSTISKGLGEIASAIKNLSIKLDDDNKELSSKLIETVKDTEELILSESEKTSKALAEISNQFNEIDSKISAISTSLAQLEESIEKRYDGILSNQKKQRILTFVVIALVILTAVMGVVF